MGEMLIDSVHDGDLVVKDDIGIVRHAVGNVVMAFKQVDLTVIDADVADRISDIHGKVPPCILSLSIL